MAILVTGGAGYIGSHTAVELISAGYEVVIVDDFSNSNPKVMDRLKEITGKDIPLYEADINGMRMEDGYLITENGPERLTDAPWLIRKYSIQFYSSENVGKCKKNMKEVFSMSIHIGHRQRLKDRFRAEGLDHFSERHVLELLLFYAIPQRDTAPVAQALLDRFDTLPQVLEAPLEELEKVPGIGHNAAVFLSLVTAAGRYYQINAASHVSALQTVADCGKYLLPRFYGRTHEVVYLLCLDAKCKVLSCKEVGEGSVNSAAVPIRKIVEIALAANATSVVLAHNHPSGIAIPSAEDIATTKLVANALMMVDVVLNDHIIVADDDYTSLLLSQLYNPDDVYDALQQEMLRNNFMIPERQAFGDKAVE